MRSVEELCDFLDFLVGRGLGTEVAEEIGRGVRGGADRGVVSAWSRAGALEARGGEVRDSATGSWRRGEAQGALSDGPWNHFGGNVC